MSDFSVYLAEVKKVLAAGNATEHTYRPAIEKLLQAQMPGAVATNEPKRQKCGAPDFVVSKNAVPLGYVECKDVGVNLDKEEGSEQMRRYKEGLGNLILTDCLDFRWFVGGQKRLSARLAALSGKNAFVPVPGGEAAVGELLSGFFQAVVPTVNSPKELAGHMADKARLLRDILARALAAENEKGSLHAQMEGFRQTLLHTLTAAEFADMYAQTICYGLFSARVHVPTGQNFTRKDAAFDLPVTNPFLRKMFGYIAGPDMASEIDWIVDDLAELLRRADMPAILADFGHRTRQEDPVVHFYETFLAAYDPKMREARGVYYTPEPVVSYIVRSVDALLRSEFGLDDGLADSSKVSVKDGAGEARDVHKVQILDPATGTGTFLHGVIDRISEGFASNKGLWSGYVKDHLLPRLFGFELLMAPYAVAHLKLGLQLKELGYTFESDERLRVYLTNTLEEAERASGLTLFARWVVEEADAAGSVKTDAPVMVVLGNPPYSGHSANKGAWIADLVADYKAGLPDLAKPGQAKWLSDDYVKFIRFAQWRIEQTGYGVLAFISNHGYLDNPTFRGMRISLRKTFDDIYVYDLHGNSKKKEHAPGGGKEENVFDIQQGVAIGIFIKRPNSPKALAAIHHAHLWGERAAKYAVLSESDISQTQWTPLKPVEPFHLFIPQDATLRAEYETGWKVPDIFNENGDPAPGIVTTQDQFAISWDKAEAVHKVEQFLDTKTEAEARELFRLCSQDQWQYARAKNELASGQWREQVTPILYRPFDTRWTVYNSNVAVHRRERVSGQMLSGNNLGLCTNRQVNGYFRHVLCTRSIINDCTVSLETRERTYLLPLYLYPNEQKAHLFDGDAENQTRRPNLSPQFIAALTEKLNCTFVPDGKGDAENVVGPEDIFHYLYAVFHAPAYRARYAEFLKIDFPRLPLTAKPALFRALCGLGERLVALHLMERTGKRKPTYPNEGTDTVEGVTHANGRVSINKTQGFEGVSADVWAFQVGGYQVCQKWLKDRKGRTLTHDDLQHYRAIVAALADTMDVMADIDAAINAHGGWPLG